jgi:catechol 2,3-dioxygenase-like lactoylglutathione lyase family enzyme
MLKQENIFSSFSVDNLEQAKEFYVKVLGLYIEAGEASTSPVYDWPGFRIYSGSFLILEPFGFVHLTSDISSWLQPMVLVCLK